MIHTTNQSLNKYIPYIRHFIGLFDVHFGIDKTKRIAQENQ